MQHRSPPPPARTHASSDPPPPHTHTHTHTQGLLRSINKLGCLVLREALNVTHFPDSRPGRGGGVGGQVLLKVF